jgi:hypothetical protein
MFTFSYSVSTDIKIFRAKRCNLNNMSTCKKNEKTNPLIDHVSCYSQYKRNYEYNKQNSSLKHGNSFFLPIFFLKIF